jgi:seryl-tRNA synthetase
MKYLRNNYEEVKAKLQHRGEDLSELDTFGELDERRRKLIAETEQLKAKRNAATQEIAKLKKEKKDAEPAIQEMRKVGEDIGKLDKELKEVEERLEQVMYSIPNIPHESVPIGEDEEDNVVHRTWGDQPVFDFEINAHWDVAANLGILDFERAAKVTGSRFVFYTGLGARLERALLNFMMDYHADHHGYEEMLPPYIVNRLSMTGTGQLPKFEEDAFKLEDWEYFLIPTAEVPVTNYHRDEIMQDLPKKYVAYSA